MSAPGALRSGLSRSPKGVGPLDENDATRSDAAAPFTALEAATVIAWAAVPGESIEPCPFSPNSFPAATATTTPAELAALRACATMSLRGSTSGSPSERLITFIPSETAASIAATISAEFPFKPKLAVGIVIAL